MKLHAVIFAGGSGTRLWPLSRAHQPKQVKPFIDDSTLLQKTYERLTKIPRVDLVSISTNASLLDAVYDQLGDVPVIIEPLKKDTAAAVGYACVKLFKENPQAYMTNAWSDHHIQDPDAYAQLFTTALEFLQQHPRSIIMAGVRPTYPETGYGYIKMGKSVGTYAEQDVFSVDCFKEKPSLETAKEYISRWEYLWNPALFFFSVEHMLDLYKQHMPTLYEGLMRIYDALGTPQELSVIQQEFDQFEKISIDYAILEKTSDLFVIPVDMGWSDIGHWKSVYDLLDADEDNKVKGAQYVGIDSYNNLIFSETDQLISTVGVRDSLVIVTKDAILICSKDEAQKVKDVVAILEENPDLRKFT